MTHRSTAPEWRVQAGKKSWKSLPTEPSDHIIFIYNLLYSYRNNSMKIMWSDFYVSQLCCFFPLVSSGRELQIIFACLRPPRRSACAVSR